MERLPLSIGILAWKSGKTLKNTLESYDRSGLFNMTDDIKIFFQECSNEDRDIAEQYDIRRIESPNNIGIGSAFVELAKYAKYKYFLTLEHDWELIEDEKTTYERLSQGINLIKDDKISAVRYRHRWNYGNPLFSRNVYEKNELSHYDSEIDAISPHLLDCVHWIENPDLRFGEYILKSKDWYYTTSKFASWTNNPVMYDTNFYIDTVEQFDGSGIKLEGSIGKWWNRKGLLVAQGEGLFKHRDLIKYG